MFDAAIASADAIPLGPSRDSAFAQLDNNLNLNAAATAVISNQNSLDPFSARIGCQTYVPAFGIDLAALCLDPGRGDERDAGCGGTGARWPTTACSPETMVILIQTADAEPRLAARSS